MCDLINFANRCALVDTRIDYHKIAKLPQAEQVSAAVEEARRSGMLPAEMPEDFIHRVVEVGKANVRVLQGYRPKPLAATVQFFAPECRVALVEVSGRTPPMEDDLGWSMQIGQSVTLHRVPGDHFTMMVDEAAAQIAAALVTCLGSCNSPAELPTSTAR